jgi:hypothetical protein
MRERLLFAGGPLSGSALDADLSRKGIDAQSPTRYPSRIIFEYDTIPVKENAELDPTAPFARGRHAQLAEYEFDADTGRYEFCQWTMIPEPRIEVGDA